MIWPWLVWWQHRHQWKADASQAEEELAVSREMWREDRERLVRPLERAGQRNMFSDMIRDALEVGYHRPASAHSEHGRGRE
jgi:hypothetical protein